MKKIIASATLATTLALAGTSAIAEEITLRIGSGHPPGVVYAGLMIDYFQPELKRRVEERTDHTINFVEGYSGSIVKVTEVLEGVQDGIIDIGGMCYCFEPSNLPLHAFQVMMPFGTMDPVQSLQIAQDVYAEVPYLTDVFPQKFNQVLLSRIADGGYNLGTSFSWEKLADLKDQKIAGAGLNLNWLKYAGVSPVQSSLATAYTEMNTNVYEGWIMFPSAWVNLKLYEPGPYYTLIGFGSMTWHGLTINQDTYNELPDDVKEILHEVAADYEEQTGIVNQKEYARLVEELRELITVTEIDPAVREAWAESLKDWPQQMADDLEGQGLPAKQVLNLVLDKAEDRGYNWPVRYEIK
ncbi:C4-dicarboxylate TRAP transporter substrate-binding protein [Roseibium album]|uniref:Neu5Ac-binding protein n=1 Tax=Roseibium album TaxID=311410 RepID=A0A0M7B099_9HYPH|nr:C4-dicarboxylate TRAP transporter substrate-binding protein [Roseibium album]MBG6159982.1 TRAP-type C4-dicarboxylate transport system substrate-binding protein [Labrenzia sp. EL_162]MBG6198514.1 TRAP-type C4-dicarboxylate transport system substrate-binding protein [Labrenzia sp. EL_159]MBG6210599.1 TRAP-type C4-dicarboxylate transport system substrate-binding protein [Labrenzia sp. EL_126]CTQ62712.1 Neu5Ac-binding protein [Roseibium album]CTQ78876.1 Neu5Ac-binding protein [Roseibium album]